MRRKIAPGDRSNSEDDDIYPPKKKKKKTSRSSIISHIIQARLIATQNENIKDENDRNGSGEEGPDSDHDQSHLRGGLLRPSELKSLEQSVSSIPDFRRLGTPVFANEEIPNGSADANNTIPEKASSIPYTLADKGQLESLSLQRSNLKRKRALLDSKEEFLELVKGRGKKTLEELKAKDKSVKDICGYDSRLSWADDEFEAWRESPDGVAMLKKEVLGLSNPDEDKTMVSGNTNSLDGQKPSSTDVKDLSTKLSDQATESVCTKKRCERHRQWYKIFTQEIAFEKDNCRVEMRQVAKEEKAVLERAQVRWLEAKVEMDKRGSEAKITNIREGVGEITGTKSETEKG